MVTEDVQVFTKMLTEDGQCLRRWRLKKVNVYEVGDEEGQALVKMVTSWPAVYEHGD